MPDSGPTVASRTAMVVGGLLIKAAQRLRDQVEAATGGTFAATYRDYAATTAPLRIDQRFEPYPGVGFDDETYRGDAYPAFGWAACVASVEVDLDTGEVHVRDVVAADDIGRVIHPVLAEGQVEGGTLQAVGYATIEEIKLRDGRYLNDRLATYIIPTVARRAADHDDPRRGAVRRRAARRQGGRRAADGRRGAGGRRRDRRCDRGLDRRPAGQPGADPGRARRASPASAPLPPGRLGAGRRRRSRPMTAFRFTVNATPVEVDVPGMRRLLDVLREDLALTGTKEGCGEGECGACTVLLDGAPVDSLPRPSARSRAPTSRRSRAWRPRATRTTPRRAPGRVPRDRRRPVRDLHAGHADGGRAYLDAGGGPDEDAIREAIAGNLCRCTGYTKIVEAIALRGSRGSPR